MFFFLKCFLLVIDYVYRRPYGDSMWIIISINYEEGVIIIKVIIRLL